MKTQAPSPGSITFDHKVVVTLAIAVVAGHVLAATLFPRALWGLHFYAFFPARALGWALAGTLAAILALVASRLEWMSGSPRTPSSAKARVAGVALVAAGVFAIFWIFRLRHTLLGDAGPLTQHLPLGEHSHPRQPLTLFLHHLGYLLARPLAGAGRVPSELAFDSVALSSTLAGVAFVFVAWSLSRHLVSAHRGAEAVPRASLPVFALLVTQGYMMLFFGYVENYTLFTLALALYLLEGLRFLSGRSSLVRCELALVVAIGLNISGAILLPSLAVLALWGLRRPDLRKTVLRDLAIGVALVVALDRSLAALGGGYDARQTIRDMWYLVAGGQGGPGTFMYLLSLEHLRDVANVHLLIGPFAAALLLPLTLHWAARGRLRDPRLLYLLGAALPPLAASWLFAEPPLGFPRDWDLFSPYGVAYAAAAAYGLATGPLDLRAFGRLVGIAAVISVFHTAPWIAVNRSEPHALERFKTLPVARGREEFYVGYWYLKHGDRLQAREWFERAVAISPANNAAQYYLGLFAMDDGRYEEAAGHFAVSVEVRPSTVYYRFALVDALVLAGQPDSAATQLQWLIQSDSTQARYWACYGVVLSGVGKPTESRQAFVRATQLAPGDSAYARLLGRAGDPDAYARAVREEWDDLVVR